MPGRSPEAGDLIVFDRHMGIWDPDGCKTLGTNAVCKELNDDAPFFSSRGDSTKNDQGVLLDDLGVAYGRTKWWEITIFTGGQGNKIKSAVILM